MTVYRQGNINFLCGKLQFESETKMAQLDEKYQPWLPSEDAQKPDDRLRTCAEQNAILTPYLNKRKKNDLARRKKKRKKSKLVFKPSIAEEKRMAG
jgi:hypothetical protein